MQTHFAKLKSHDEMQRSDSIVLADDLICAQLRRGGAHTFIKDLLSEISLLLKQAFLGADLNYNETDHKLVKLRKSILPIMLEYRVFREAIEEFPPAAAALHCGARALHFCHPCALRAAVKIYFPGPRVRVHYDAG